MNRSVIVAFKNYLKDIIIDYSKATLDGLSQIY